MVNQDIIRSKIASIENNLARLKEKQNITLQEFKGNIDLQDIILHNLQLSIQGCIDIASHIVSDNGWEVPATLAGLFDILAKHKIISGDLNERLKKMAGFRNIIIHEYSVIDLNLVHNIFTEKLKDIYLYLKQVCIYCKI